MKTIYQKKQNHQKDHKAQREKEAIANLTWFSITRESNSNKRLSLQLSELQKLQIQQATRLLLLPILSRNMLLSHLKKK